MNKSLMSICRLAPVVAFAGAALVACSAAPGGESTEKESSASRAWPRGFLAYGGSPQNGTNPFAVQPMCLEAAGGAVQASAIQIDACNSGNSQKFYLGGSGQIEIGGLCLDVAGLDYSAGNVWLWPCWGGPNQQWLFVDGRIKPAASPDKCLTVENAARTFGTQLHLESCSDTPPTAAAQIFWPFGMPITLLSDLKQPGALFSDNCLEVDGPSPNAGAGLNNDVCNAQNAYQTFYLTQNDQLLAENPWGMCVKITGVQPGGAGTVQLESCTGSLEEMWNYAGGFANLSIASGFHESLETAGGAWQAATPVGSNVFSPGASKQTWHMRLAGL